MPRSTACDPWMPRLAVRHLRVFLRFMCHPSVFVVPMHACVIIVLQPGAGATADPPCACVCVCGAKMRASFSSEFR